MTIDRDGGWTRLKRDCLMLVLGALLGAVAIWGVVYQHVMASCWAPYAACREAQGAALTRAEVCEYQAYESGFKLRQPPR